MRKIISLLIFGSLIIISCSKDEESIGDPSDINIVNTEPRIGGALVSWEIPSDTNFTYIELRYLKNEKEVLHKISKYTDTLLVKGLINAEEFVFELQTVNEIPGAIAKGNPISTEPVRPIRREPEITYFEDQLEQINITEDMLDTYTQEVYEGPKANLVDGDPSTYWHSAWSGGVAPLPHWIEVRFDEPTELGAITYWLRNSADPRGRPTQIGLDISDDGENWETVFESGTLPANNVNIEYELNFERNYEARYFRIVILNNQSGGSATFTHLGEIAFYKMQASVVDKEEEAEEEYYTF